MTQNNITIDGDVKDSQITLGNNNNSKIITSSTIFNEIKDVINKANNLNDAQKKEALNDLSVINDAVNEGKAERSKKLFNLLPPVIQTCDAGIKLLATITSLH